jgi:hypothetical protein
MILKIQAGGICLKILQHCSDHQSLRRNEIIWILYTFLKIILIIIFILKFRVTADDIVSIRLSVNFNSCNASSHEKGIKEINHFSQILIFYNKNQNIFYLKEHSEFTKG